MPNLNTDDEGRVWKWAITPHPYSNGHGVMFTDDDMKALDAILFAAEAHLWDSNDDDTRTLTVSHHDDCGDRMPNVQAHPTAAGGTGGAQRKDSNEI